MADVSHFASWTEGRTLASLGTNDGSRIIAFQGWHHFKEAFPPELIWRAVNESKIAVRRCYDPFGGSGTTVLACQMLGVAAQTVEVNPFLIDVIEAKVATYDPDVLIRQLAAVRRRASQQKFTGTIFQGLPPTFVEPGLGDRWLFNRDVAFELANILNAIDETADVEVRRLFRVVVGGLLADVSNAIVSGKGRRYRRNWRSREIEPVEAVFARRAESVVRDIIAFNGRPRPRIEVSHGDSRTIKPTEPIELAVFSPPYPNSFDYTDVYNMELWMLGYLTTKEDNRHLRQKTLTSHVQVHRNYPPPPKGSRTLMRCLRDLEAVRDDLWNRHIPAMVGAYFADLVEVLENISPQLDPRGSVWIVVGDSCYASQRVPVAKILAEISRTRGWAVQHVGPIRHMKSSAQQGWEPRLAESLLVLRPSSGA